MTTETQSRIDAMRAVIDAIGASPTDIFTVSVPGIAQSSYSDRYYPWELLPGVTLESVRNDIVNATGRVAHLSWSDIDSTHDRSLDNVLSDDTAVPVYLVREASHGDYGGSGTIGMANHRDLMDSFGPEVDTPVHVIPVGFSSTDGQSIVVPIESLIPTGNEDHDSRAEYLVDILAGLRDYPLIDDGTQWEVEEELLSESLEDGGWIIADIRAELSDNADDALSDADIRAAFFDYVRRNDIQIEYEYLTPSMHGYVDGQSVDITKAVAVELNARHTNGRASKA